MERRYLITGVFPLILAGCIRRGVGNKTRDEKQNSDERDRSNRNRSSKNGFGSAGSSSSEISEGSGVGNESVVFFEHEIKRDTVEYLEKSDSIRYVAYWRNTNDGEREPIYNTRRFERWAPNECASAAARKVQKIIDNRLNSDAIRVAVTSENIVAVGYTRSYDREGKPGIETRCELQEGPRSGSGKSKREDKDRKP